MSNALTSDIKASTYFFKLSSKSTVYRNIAKDVMDVWYLQVLTGRATKTKEICTLLQFTKNLRKNTVSPPRSWSANNECSPYSSLWCSLNNEGGNQLPDRPGDSHSILAHHVGTTSTCNNNSSVKSKYLSMKRSCVYKAINTYQQISWLPLSVYIKQEKPIIYGTNFMQSGHYES